MRKKGVSPIIATVLLVLLAVILIGAMWTTIIPYIRDKLREESLCKDTTDQLKILNDGFTCAEFYNDNKKKDIISLHVRRGPKDIKLIDIIFIFESRGNSWSWSYARDIEPGLKSQKLPVPGIPSPNEEKQYYVTGKFSTEKLTYGAVSISPVIREPLLKNIQCPATSFVKLTPCLAREIDY